MPEVKLGIIPGWGGTQRLPRLVGLPEALKIILPGKTVDAAKAKKIKLVDQVASAALIDQARQSFVQNLRDKTFRSALRNHRKARGSLARFMQFLLTTSVTRYFIIRQARKGVIKTSKGHYPAPLAVLDVLATKCSFSEGLERELQAFSKLAASDIAKNLVGLYFLNEEMKRDQGSEFCSAVSLPKSAAVLGAGVMGGGIAWLLSQRGLSVRMKDISWDAIAQGYAQANHYFSQLSKHRRIKRKQIERAMNRIGGSIDYSGFSRVDLVVEAVVEDMEVKKRVLAETESYIADSALLCSNTSALSISEMANVLVRPENFCGMHFFNPVNRMPLVEIVRGKQTSAESLARAVAMVKELGKSPVVVQDCPGFLVNRILLPYMNEAAYLLQEGVDIEQVDQALTEFGMPLGPFQLADQVGIDVGYKVARILETGYGKRMATCPLLTTIYADMHLLGKKGGNGFYRYQGKKVTVNPDITHAVARYGKSLNFNDNEIIDRLLLIMVNEAARCLDEKVVESPGQLDFAMIMGTGFPPWRGGLCRWADSVGLDKIVEKCASLDAVIEERYQVSPYLRELAISGRGFYS